MCGLCIEARHERRAAVGRYVRESEVLRRLWCKVDAKMRQDGNTKDMIFKIPHLIEVSLLAPLVSCMISAVSWTPPHTPLSPQAVHQQHLHAGGG